MKKTTRVINYCRRHKRWLFLAALWLVSRLVALLWLAPHNDEIIYTQYAQLMHTNWQQHKYLSVSGQVHGDFKEPLQYWLNSLTINWLANPLLTTRLWALLFGALGLIFTVRLAAEIFDKRRALLVGALITLSSYFFYFDTLALAEVYVYGLGAVWLFYFFRWLRRGEWLALALAIAAYSAASLIKISAALWLVLALWLLAWSFIQIRQINPRGARWLVLKGLAAWLAALLTSLCVAKYFIPAEFLARRAASPAGQAVFSWRELVAFPYQSWLANLQFYFSQVIISDAGGITCLLLIIAGAVLAWRTRRSHLTREYFWLIGWWLISFLPFIFLAKAQYIRYFGLGFYFFYFLVATAIVLISQVLTKRGLSFKHLALGLIIILLLNQLAASYGPALAFGQTELGQLETRDTWASPLGFKNTFAYLQNLPAGVLLYDNRWGYWGSAIEVWHQQLSNLQLFRLDNHPEKSLAAAEVWAKKNQQPLYILFDSEALNFAGRREFLGRLLTNNHYCGQRQEIAKVYRGRQLKGYFIIICHSN